MTSKPPPPPKPPCSIHPTAIIADKAVLAGTHLITIAENVILHPYARINSSGGPVTIGANTIVYERAAVGCETGSVTIGSGCVIDSSATCSGSVDDCSEIGVGAYVGKNAQVGKWCKVTALERVEDGEEVEDFGVVFADGRRRVDTAMRDHEGMREVRNKGQMMSLELMRKLVPSAASKWTTPG
ncbi:hypothetical protein KC340_g3005 [Hortaea werneckii]|nr:hypothetical protein KC342_g3590 [Hortaea werneckii]KAI7103506.1 hypothetical protein KC339_g5221 [Hortaea werneckii]KAI7244207.1 hypothetical protein KC365_g1608 [Hortaea werneckii]KAI7333226.1 hypothetical protein KC340_g3005 [Hortaea werneckii]KAI7378842.1 hypothetical protein KC328_g13677 [Hortaea werneckii]